MERWRKKPWGRMRPVLQNADVRIEQIAVDRGGYCSIHYHAEHPNAFSVLQGELLVVFNDRGLGSYRIVAGDHLIVPPGLTHQFIAATPVLAIEVYTASRTLPADADVVDIVRLTPQGGVLSPSRLRAALLAKSTIA